MIASLITHLVDVLTLELRDELLEAVFVGLDANSAKNLLHIAGRGRGVTADLEKEVGSQVTHLYHKFAGMVRHMWLDLYARVHIP